MRNLAKLLAALQAHGLEGPGQAGDAPAAGRRDFYRHIALPPHYVPRGPVLSELVALVCSDHPTVALTSGMPAQPAPLHGMGGLGKSVLARALCEHPEIRAAFPDGILWTTLGQTPDVKSCLREWLGALGVTVPGTAPTINELAEGLAAALETRACLLVVDDLWAADHRRCLAARDPSRLTSGRGAWLSWCRSSARSGTATHRRCACGICMRCMPPGRSWMS